VIVAERIALLATVIAKLLGFADHFQMPPAVHESYCHAVR
jgi:hypothetical protein